MRRRIRAAAWVPVLALVLTVPSFTGGCDAFTAKKDGTECARCDSSRDCNEGLTCRLFTGGQLAIKMCAKSSTSRCSP